MIDSKKMDFYFLLHIINIFSLMDFLIISVGIFFIIFEHDTVFEFSFLSAKFRGSNTGVALILIGAASVIFGLLQALRSVALLSSSGGVGGNAKVIGSGEAHGGQGGKAGSFGSGGNGGNALVNGSGQAKGGAGGNG